MHTRPLGRTGVRVSPYTLGTMMFGRAGNPDHDECVRVIHRALDHGINTIDTADVYGGEGGTEEIVGRALRGRRNDVVLATKFSGPMGPEANQRGSSRRWIVSAVEGSLRRLGMDHIDLHQVHRPRPTRRSPTSRESAPPAPPTTTAPPQGGTSEGSGGLPRKAERAAASRSKTGEQQPVSRGAMGIRTPDLLHAMEARYQLRHSPLYAGRFPRSAMELLYRRLGVGCDLRACGWTCGGRFPRRIPWSGARIKA